MEAVKRDAASAFAQGRVSEASVLLDEILSHDSANSFALLHRGRLAYGRKDYHAALADWDRVPDDSPDASQARTLEGIILLEQGFASEAEDRLLRSIEIGPLEHTSYLQLLQLYVLQARRDAVRELIARIAESRPWTLGELVLRVCPAERVTKSDAAISELRRHLKADPDGAIHSANALALYLMEQERLTEAEDVLRHITSKDPENELATSLLARSQALQGKSASAKQTVASLSLSKRSSTALWKSHAQLAEADSDWAKAATCYREVIEGEPEDSVALYRLGIVTHQLGSADEAHAYLERAAKLEQMQQQALRLVSGTGGRPEQALPIIVEVGQLLLELGYSHEASRWFDQALQLHPTEPAALAGMQRAMHHASQNMTSYKDPFGPRKVATSPGTPPRSFASSASSNRGLAQLPSERSVSTAIVFQDCSEEAGLDFTYFNGDTGFKHLVESMGGGIGVIDFDVDGRPDLYFPQGCSLPPDAEDQTHLDRLYRNIGGGKFADMTGKTGITENRYGQGITVGDYDSDGFDDVLVGNYGRNTLWQNNGDGTFTDVTEVAGLGGSEEMTSSLAFADLDLDGHLDLYVVNYVTSLKVCQDSDGAYHSCSPTNFDAQQDRLYRNRADGTFEDVTEASGVVAADGKGLGVVVADFDDDGRPDIYVANDTTPNFLFQNSSVEGNLTFLEKGLTSGVALSGEGRAQAGMGIAAGDFNGDGRLDLHVTNFYQEPNALYLNLGDGLFADSIRNAGLAEPSFAMLGFGTQAGDFDLDGDQDLFVANGHIDDFRSRGEPWKMPPQLFANRGDGRFLDVSEQSGPYFAGEYLGRGVARVDYDGDGRPDLAVVHQDRPVGLLHNETENAGHALVLDLYGRTSNRDAISAKIIVTTGDRVQTLQICGGDGFFSSNDKRQIVGLGSATEVSSVEIRWPNGTVDRWQDLPVNVRLICREGLRPVTQPIR